jgi:hypothetical protein
MRVRTEERSRGDDERGRDGGKKEEHILGKRIEI